MFFLTTVLRSIRRQWRKRALIALTVCLSAIVSVSMLGIVFDVQDKLSAELSSYGSNIMVRAKSDALVDQLYETVDSSNTATSTALLDEQDAKNIKTIFWAYNITNFAPRLDTTAHINTAEEAVPVIGTWFANTMTLETGESTVAGVSGMRNWWTLQGDWPQDNSDEAIIGSALAQDYDVHVGDTITLNQNSRTTTLHITGIFSSQDDDESSIYTSTAQAQYLQNAAGKISAIEVKALTTPDNELAQRAAKNPAMLSQEEWETWYCTAYASSIAYQIEEAIPGAVARQIRQVSTLQGDVMTKTRTVMIVMTVLCIVAAALAVANLMSAAISERSTELALLKAVGARNGEVIRLLLAETAVVALAGLIAGSLIGIGVAQGIGQIVFHASITIRPLVLLLVAVLLCASVCIASLAAIRSVITLQPAQVLHGR